MNNASIKSLPGQLSHIYVIQACILEQPAIFLGGEGLGTRINKSTILNIYEKAYRKGKLTKRTRKNSINQKDWSLSMCFLKDLIQRCLLGYSHLSLVNNQHTKQEGEKQKQKRAKCHGLTNLLFCGISLWVNLEESSPLEKLGVTLYCCLLTIL